MEELPKKKRQMQPAKRKNKRKKQQGGEEDAEGVIDVSSALIPQEGTLTKRKKKGKKQKKSEWSKNRLLPGVLKSSKLINFHVKAMLRLLIRETQSQNWTCCAAVARSLFRFYNVYPKIFFPLLTAILKHIDADSLPRFYRKFIAKKQFMGELVVMELGFLLALSGQLEVAYDHLSQSLRGLETSAWIHGYMALFGLKIAMGLKHVVDNLARREEKEESALLAVTEDKMRHFFNGALHSIRVARYFDPRSDNYLNDHLRILNEWQGSVEQEKETVLDQFREQNPSSSNGIRLKMADDSLSVPSIKKLLECDPLSQFGFDSAVTLFKHGHICNQDLARICCNRLDFLSEDLSTWEILARCLFLEFESDRTCRHLLEPHLSWWAFSPSHFAFGHVPQNSFSQNSLTRFSPVAKLCCLRATCAKLLGIDLDKAPQIT